jgi:DhnA family fructose-bisphosphate aldolase class Ia
LLDPAFFSFLRRAAGKSGAGLACGRNAFTADGAAPNRLIEAES